MKRLLLFSFLLGIFLCISCAEETENTESFDKNSYSIEFGSECGWCAGQEFIKIAATKIEYTRTIPCGDEKGTVTKSRTLSETEWMELMNSFNFEEFLALDYNTCNVCVDGCDEIIRIGEDETIHEIRYTPGSEIEGIELLTDKLRDFMEEMHDAD